MPRTIDLELLQRFNATVPDNICKQMDDKRPTNTKKRRNQRKNQQKNQPISLDPKAFNLTVIN